MQLKREKVHFKKYARVEYKQENVKWIDKGIEFNDKDNCLDFFVEVKTQTHYDKFYFDGSTLSYDDLVEWELESISNKFEVFKH